MVDQIQLSYLEAMHNADVADQKNILLARNYHEGEQTVYMTDRAKEFLALQKTNTFRMNICRPVVTAVKDELNVIGFDTGEPSDGLRKLAQWAWETWLANQMDAVQKDIHEMAMRDREAFVIVDWDKDHKRPRLTAHQRYTATDAGGDGLGCMMVYPDDDINQPAICGIKRWTETIRVEGRKETRQRATVYYPDRVERYVYGKAGWEEYAENPGDAWPISWKNTDGEPLGIAMIHFKNAGLRPEAWDAIPMQDAVNKILIDALAAADVTGFRIFKAFGWIPTTDGKEPAADGSNWLQIRPGGVYGSTKSDGIFEAIEAADVTPLIDVLTQLILYTAMITDTPVSRFVATKQVASSDTLKDQEKPLKKKANDRRVIFGNAWESCMDLARRLANIYGQAGLDEKLGFSTLWQHSESLEELKQKRELGIPEESLWREAGYSPDQIKAMKETDEYQAKLALMAVGLSDGGS
jgi:hypothetical protein